MLVEIFIVIMVIVCFILYELATMSPLRWHPPHHSRDHNENKAFKSLFCVIPAITSQLVFNFFNWFIFTWYCDYLFNWFCNIFFMVKYTYLPTYLPLYLGDQLWQQAVLVFLDFYFFVFISLPMCQSVCGSVGLLAIHFKFLKTCCYEVPRDLWVKKW